MRQSRNLGVDAIPRLGRLQEIRWDVFRQLVLLSPLSELLEVAALVLGIEVDEWLGMVGVYPELTEDANIHGAHELLPYDIEAVCYTFISLPSGRVCSGSSHLLTCRLTMNSSFLNAPWPRSR